MSRSVKTNALVATIGVVLFVLWVWAAQPGPRGSDQFWYSGYVDQLRLHGRPASNYLLPSAWNTDYPPPPVHHLPAVYLAYALGYLGLTSYWSWQVGNVLFICTGLMLFHRATREVRGPDFARWATVLVACFPLTFWMAINPLAEASLYACGGLLALGLAIRWKSAGLRGNILIVTSVTIMTLTRSNHVLLLVGLIPLFLWTATDRKVRTSIALAIALCLAALFLRRFYLPEYPIVGGLTSLIMTPARTLEFVGVPRLFSTKPMVFDFWSWVAGALPNLLLPVLFVPAMAFGGLAIWIKKRRSGLFASDAVTLLLLSVATMVATALVFQIQFRYWTGTYLPCALIAFYSLPPISLQRGQVKVLASVSVTLMLLVTGILSYKVRAEAIASARQLDRITLYAAQHLQNQQSLMVWDSWGAIFTYALPKTRIVLAATSLQTDEELLEAMRRFDIGVVLVSRTWPRGLELANRLQLRPLPPLDDDPSTPLNEFLAFQVETTDTRSVLPPPTPTPPS